MLTEWKAQTQTNTNLDHDPVNPFFDWLVRSVERQSLLQAQFTSAQLLLIPSLTEAAARID